jgi:hypothetical protein
MYTINMSVTSKQKELFERLVKKVPDSLKAETASKVKHALELGWKDLFFWDPKQAHPADLFGANLDGVCDVVPNSPKEKRNTK